MSVQVSPEHAICSEGHVRVLLAQGAVDTGLVLALLDEQHPVYDGIDSFAVTRIRGALLLALTDTPQAIDGLPFVLEELESAHDAYLTAAAAQTLRKIAVPDPGFVQPLLDALLYIRHRDDRVHLDSYGGYGTQGESTTAMAQVLETIGWLGAAGTSAVPRLDALRNESPGPRTTEAVDQALRAIESGLSSSDTSSGCCGEPDEIVLEPAASDCCGSNQSDVDGALAGRPTDLVGVEFQDQSGERLRFEEFFVGAPTIVVFFYTRCENPAKCPLTISKLGRLQRQLAAENLDGVIRTAAITYDPGYDLPARLEQFGRSWGATSDPNNRLLRTPGDFSIVREFFQLGVSYGPTVVNRHQLEAYVLDANGQIAGSSTRLRWSEHDLIEQAKALIKLNEDEPSCCASSFTDEKPPSV